VKKVFFNVSVLIVMMMAASCTGAPKDQGGSSVPEVSESKPSQQEEAPPVIPEEASAEESVPEEIPEEIPDEEYIAEEPVSEEEPPEDYIDEEYIAEEPIPEEPIAEEPDIEEPVPEEPVLAEVDEADDIEPVEVDEPEPPVVAAAPEPEPAPPPMPPPPPVSPPPSPPSQVAARPSPAEPLPAEPPPPPAEPPPAEEEEPPVIVREPPPRIAPELPNPTPAIRSYQDEEVVFSRVVRATVGQLVVVPFRGTGWVYLGETGARRGIVYDSRRLDPEGQSFIFRTEAAGEYALKFYRQDFVRDFILNDYVQVIVGAPSENAGAGWFNPPIDRGRVIAEPRWPTSLAEAQALRADTRAVDPSTLPPTQTPAQSQTQPPPVQTPPTQTPAQPSSTQTQAPPSQPPPAQSPPQSPLVQQPPIQSPPTQTPPAQLSAESPSIQVPPDLAPEAYLDKAKEEFDAGRIAAAISLLDQFSKYFPIESDEVLWLYGQLYEANSPSRNILAALDCYRRLMQEYPQSNRYDDARRRVAYLQRYYINIQ